MNPRYPELAGRVADALRDGHCRGYALVAAPRFLGLLREALARTGADEPYLSIDKEMVDRDARTIEQLLVDKAP